MVIRPQKSIGDTWSQMRSCNQVKSRIKEKKKGIWNVDRKTPDFARNFDSTQNIYQACGPLIK